MLLRKQNENVTIFEFHDIFKEEIFLALNIQYLVMRVNSEKQKKIEFFYYNVKIILFSDLLGDNLTTILHFLFV